MPQEKLLILLGLLTLLLVLCALNALLWRLTRPAVDAYRYEELHEAEDEHDLDAAKAD
jgi:uncharacterized protein YhdP